MNDDAELLRRYADTGAEEAFAELVRRHLDLTWAAAYRITGDPELARGYYEEALALVESTGEAQLLFPCYDGLATLYLDRDDTERAEEFMRKAQQVCERAGLDPDSFVVLPFLE